jgi:hypothetical protein
MTPFEYLLLFTLIVLGVAVNDLAGSLHRLLGRKVRWGVLAPLAAVVAFLKIVSQWWTWYNGAGLANGLTFELFLGILTGSVLLSLLAACSLPDEMPAGEPIDLRAHYARVARQYWILFLLHWLVASGMSVLAEMTLSGRVDLGKSTYLIPPLAVSLLLIRARWWHGVCLASFIVYYVTQLFGRTLS